MDSDINFGGNKNINLDGRTVRTNRATYPAITATQIAESPTTRRFAGPVKIGIQSMDQGHLSTGGRRFYGDMSEILVFNRDISTTEETQVRSYLSLKYGITLDQTTPTSYLASNGTTRMWDESLGKTYNHDIFGIGLDSASGLDQRVSKSQNPSTVFTCLLYTSPSPRDA